METKDGMSLILLFEGIPFHKWLHTDVYGNLQYDLDLNAIEAFIESGDCGEDHYKYILGVKSYKQ